ncbi:MAG: hypothetical protein QXS00_09970 [Pyrobaculum sp.]
MPSWRTHRAIVKAAWPPELPRGELLRGILRGVVEPDIEADLVTRCRKKRCREARAPHHDPPEALVRWYYDLAHFFRARGDMYSAGRALGRALHYLHDGAVKTKKWLLLNVHDDVEAQMDQLASQLPHICNGAKHRRSNNPVEALCHAYALTSALLRQFAADAISPQVGAYYKARGRRKKIYATSAVVVAAVATAVAMPYAALVPAAVGLLAISFWTPRDYVLAMRGGAMCLRPTWGRPAMTC